MATGVIVISDVDEWKPTGTLVESASAVQGLDRAPDDGFRFAVAVEPLVMVEIDLETREPVLGHAIAPAHQ
ncbi:MAG: hypothetical protein HLX51_13840 [Micrococcaceae bacterium]|nr:hypothetical protein [Micrococcaceae bacterium]